MKRLSLALALLGAFVLGTVAPRAAAAADPFAGIERELRSIRTELARAQPRAQSSLMVPERPRRTGQAVFSRSCAAAPSSASSNTASIKCGASCH